MYVRGTLCFMLQAKWTPKCPDQKEVQISLQRLHAYFFVLITEEGLDKGVKEEYTRLNADFGDGVANGQILTVISYEL